VKRENYWHAEDRGKRSDERWVKWSDIQAVLDTEGDQPTLQPQAGVTRLEVIGPKGRIFTQWDCAVELSYQDAGRTLKVFVDWPAKQ
jgi:hypothetical protein